MSSELVVFLNNLEHDHKFAVENYNNDDEWRMYINSMFEHLTNYVAHFSYAAECTNKNFLEFLDFIQGNGFIWEMELPMNLNDDIQSFNVTIFPKYLTA